MSVKFDSWSPLSISGCQMWLRSDVGVILNGSTVSTWIDQSGNINNVSQATVGDQPTFTPITINGKPGINFTSGDAMTRSVADPITSNFTIVAVLNINAILGANYQGIYGNNAGLLYAVPGSGSDWGIYLGAPVDSSKIISDGNYHILICSVVSVSGAVTFYTDGVMTTGVGTSAYTTGSGQVGNGLGSGGGQPLTGNLTELIEYNSILSTTQVKQLTQYLSAKYIIPVFGQT